MVDLNGEEKFNTCSFRSESEQERTIPRCPCNGGPFTDSGFFCEKRAIFKITKEICQECQEYVAK